MHHALHIDKIVLHKYNRIFLSNITTLTLRPNNMLTLILSMNGSGKSSLLSELSPLPGNLSKDFEEGGYKIIELSHRGIKYILTSGVGGTRKHSFLKDNTELNDGGTISVQKRLVLDHFGIDRNIHQLLLGNNNFTKMSLNERKKWITYISNIDYVYAFTTYNKLKSRHRDILGGIKLVQDNIIKAENTAISKEDLSIMKTTVKYLVEFTDHLLMLYSNNNVTEDDSIEKLKKLNVVTQKLIKDNKELVSIDVNDITAKITNKENSVQEITDNLKTLQGKLFELDKAGVSTVNLDIVNRDIDKLDKIVDGINKDLYLDIELTDLNKVIDTVISLQPTVLHIRNEIDTLGDVDITLKPNLVDKVNNLLITRTTIQKKLDIENVRLEELLGNKHKCDITCGNCGHTWKPGYTEEREKSYNSNISKLDITITKVNKDIDAITTTLGKIESKEKLISELMSELKTIPGIKKYLYDNINNDDVSLSVGNVFNRLIVDIDTWKKVPSMLSELESLKNDKLHAELTVELKHKLKNLDKERVLEDINKLKDKEIVLLKELDKLKLDYQNKSRLMRMRDILESVLKKYYRNKKREKVVIRDKYLSKSISYLKSEVIRIQEEIDINSRVLNTLSNNKKLLKDYQARDKVLRVLLKELSPSEGLIAESINSFLNVFIEDMNTFINTVWEYEVKLLPCNVGEGNDLDYKFKVLIDGKKLVDDIKETSSSQQEIIDLAFRLMFIKYNNMTGYPLIMDEFGTTFDSRHRITAYNTIDRILNSDFSQIFMVNHFESMYGRFTNADVAVMNTNGVDLSTVKDYNTTLTLE